MTENQHTRVGVVSFSFFPVFSSHAALQLSTHQAPKALHNMAMA